MTLLSPALRTVVIVEAISDQQLIDLVAQSATTVFGIVDRDTLPARAVAELEELGVDVRDDLIDARLVDDDPEHAPEMRLRRLRERLRQNGRSLLAGTAIRHGRRGDETVLVLALPTGVLRRAEVSCVLEPA
jgi:hypothetical protein